MRSLLRSLTSGLLCLGLLSLIGCTTPPNQTPPTAAATPGSTPTAVAVNSTQTPVNLGDKVKFKLDNGADAFSLKPQANGAKLVNGTDQEVARFTVDEKQKIKIKDAQDQVLGYVTTQPGVWKLKNPDQTQELYILRRQADGDYKLEDGRDRQVYRIKARDYGFEIQTPDQRSLYKVKLKGDKLSLRNAQDQTVLSTRAEILPIALVCFGLDDLTPEQQAGLAYAVTLAGGQ